MSIFLRYIALAHIIAVTIASFCGVKEELLIRGAVTAVFWAVAALWDKD